MFAHVLGIPVEETVAALVPGGAALAVAVHATRDRVRRAGASVRGAHVDPPAVDRDPNRAVAVGPVDARDGGTQG